MINNNNLTTYLNRNIICNGNAKSLPNKSKNNIMKQNNNFDNNIIILKEGLTDNLNKCISKIDPFFIHRNNSIKKLSYSDSKYHHNNIRKKAEKRDLSLILNRKSLNLKPLNTSKMNNSHPTTINDFSFVDKRKRNKRFRFRSPICDNNQPKSENYNDIINLEKI